MQAEAPDVRAAALAALQAGLNPHPPREDGSKAPLAAGGEWRSFQERLATAAEVERWYANGRTGLGLICGRVSGGLEMFEFEGRAVAAGLNDAFVAAVEAAGLMPLLDRIVSGYMEATPSGGLHLLYRCPEPRTEKLARDEGRLPLIETKGEGGYTIVAPTRGRVHPNGGEWRLLQGDFSTIAAVSAEERAELHRIARLFDRTPAPPVHDDAPLAPGGQRPGDDFNQRASWAEILEPHGWARVYARREGAGTVTAWRRPGKTAGVSATTNHSASDLLYVFSSSTIFEPDRGYSKFSAYAVLNHAGDMAAAARALAERGYGEQRGVVDRQRQHQEHGGTPPHGGGGEDDERDVLRLTIRSAASRVRAAGGAFILDTPAKVTAVWGEGEGVAWAQGEPAMINGPTGVGKTTVAQQVVLGRLGLRREVLGMPVALEERRVLYLACDRPKQVARSFRRMVDEEDRAVLDERLVVWRGPLPYDLVKRPEVLVTMAEEFDAGTVVVDSLKDVAVKLSEDEPGSRVNQALQLCSVADVEVLVLHHQRKAQQGGGKPTSVDDVYGSTWLTAGMGSILLVWGTPGDLVVELTHLKQPSELIGPLTLVHDHIRGVTRVEGGVDLLDLVRSAPKGLTAEEAAKAIYRKVDPKRNEIERARRRLDGLVVKELVHRRGGERDTSGRQKPAVYYPVARP